MMIKEQPSQIELVQLDCLLMPQGEVIYKGKTIGWFKDLKKHLTLTIKDSSNAKT